MESIGSLIRAVVDDTQGSFTAEEIAQRVVERIDPERYEFYLHSLVVHRVSSEVGALRDKVSPVRRGKSTKQMLIRDEYWPKFLAQKIALPSGYKPLSDATADDLIFVAQMRRSQANDLLGKAAQFEKLAELMRVTGAKTLARLDPQAGEKLLAA